MSITTTDPKERSTLSRAGALIAWLRPAPDPRADGAEVLEFFSPSAAVLGMPARPIARRIIEVVFSMVVIIFIIFCTYPIDRIAMGNGKTLSLTPELVVQPLNPAVVKTIAVSEGDIVRKGQLLAQLDPTVAVADTASAKEQVDRYATEVDRLGAELHQYAYHPKMLSAGALVQESIFAQRAAARDAQLRYYQGQIDAQKALIAQSEANIKQYALETGIAFDIEKMRHQLEAEQVGSRLDTLAAVNQRIEDERFVLTWIDQRDNAIQTVAALTGQLESYNQQWFADVSQTLTDDSVQLANYQDQLEHAALSLKWIDLRADQDAIVLAVAPVSVGSVLQAGATFFTLVPLNAPMEIDSQITGDISGFVVSGMPATIKFQSFPYETYGMAFGTVRQISADSFLTGSPPANTSSGTASDMVFTGTAVASPFYYDVRVSLDRFDMMHMPRDFHLIPGMPVEVDIKVGDQTIMDYLTVRIRPVFDEGFREPT